MLIHPRTMIEVTVRLDEFATKQQGTFVIIIYLFKLPYDIK